MPPTSTAIFAFPRYKTTFERLLLHAVSGRRVVRLDSYYLPTEYTCLRISTEPALPASLGRSYVSVNLATGACRAQLRSLQLPMGFPFFVSSCLRSCIATCIALIKYEDSVLHSKKACSEPGLIFERFRGIAVTLILKVVMTTSW